MSKRNRRASFTTMMTLVLLAAALAFAFVPEYFKKVQTSAQTSTGASLNGDFTLAVSWQPAFCETLPKLPECRAQKEGRFDATHFTLHGLWPNPRSNVYCGVSKADQRLDKDRRWKDLPALALSKSTRSTLTEVMPGVVSNLHRHEWIKHGTCSGVSAQAYYDASLALMEVLNTSNVQILAADNIGQQLTARDIRAAFDQAFGAGSGEHVEVDCLDDGRRQLIGELRIGLKGTIDEGFKFGDLMINASPRREGCRAGLIDPVGLQ